MRHWKSLLVFLALAFLAGASGSANMPDAWYAALAKPWFNPPNWVFGPVWAVLYVLMAVAAWRVYRRVGVGREIIVWIIQLVVNAAWSPLFFRFYRIDLALIDVLLLVAFVTALVILFWRRDRIAGYLLLPYLAWGAFATVLTASIWHLNQG